MTFDPALTFLAVATAGGLWLIVEANLRSSRERKAMTPEQRAEHDEEMRRFGQEW